MTILGSLRGLTVKLQKRSVDAYEQISEVQLELELMKLNCEEELHLLFEKRTLSISMSMLIELWLRKYTD